MVFPCKQWGERHGIVIWAGVALPLFFCPQQVGCQGRGIPSSAPSLRDPGGGTRLSALPLPAPQVAHAVQAGNFRGRLGKAVAIAGSSSNNSRNNDFFYIKLGLQKFNKFHVHYFRHLDPALLPGHDVSPVLFQQLPQKAGNKVPTLNQVHLPLIGLFTEPFIYCEFGALLGPPPWHLHRL